MDENTTPAGELQELLADQSAKTSETDASADAQTPEPEANEPEAPEADAPAEEPSQNEPPPEASPSVASAGGPDAIAFRIVELAPEDGGPITRVSFNVQELDEEIVIEAGVVFVAAHPGVVAALDQLPFVERAFDVTAEADEPKRSRGRRGRGS